MKKLILLSSLLTSTTVFSASYVVEMNTPLSPTELSQLRANQDIKAIQRFTPYSSEYFDRLYSIEFEGSLSELSKLDNVKLVESDFKADFFEIKPNPQSEMTTNDLLFPLQWGLQNQNQIVSKQLLKGGVEETVGVSGVDIGWKNAINKIETNLKKSPVVAVVDMGVDIDHPELKDQIFRNEAECDSDGKVPMGQRVDKDNNKYEADCFGFNFAATSPEYFQFPYDDKNHGTHVAGIIAAKRDNNTGVSGVSDKIKILPVKVTGRVDETSDRANLLIKAPSKRIANGILYAVRRGVDVINLSLGWPKSMDTNFMRNVIREAISKNIVVVAAAGNNNTNGNIFPCAYEDVVCVGSVDVDGSISNFSNYGGEVDILAPGDNILSTIPTQFIPLKMNIQGYDILSGTSQAAPYVSAAAALIKGVFPKSSIHDVMRRLYDSAKPKKDSFKSLHGLLNLENAFSLKLASSIKPVFKLNSEIIFDPRNGDFNMLLPIRNYGKKDENILVELFFKDPNIRLKANSITFPEVDNYDQMKAARLKEEQRLGKKLPDMSVLNFQGRIFNKYMDNQTRFKVVISKLDAEGKKISSEEFEHEVVISKQFFTPSNEDPEALNFVFQDPNKKVPVGLWDNEEKKLNDNLRTAETLGIIESDMPSYYVKYQAQAKEGETLPVDQDGIRLYFFEHENGNYQERKNNFFVYKAVKLLSVLKGDYNYDGQADYLIKTVVKPENEDGYILYSYRNLDMEPLVGSKYSDIRYYPMIVNVTPETVRLMKTTLPNGMSLATPYFLNSGALPDADQVNDPWSDKDRSVLRRIYSLQIKDGDNPEFVARTSMNMNFVTKVRTELKDKVSQTIALNDTTVEIVQLLSQTKEDYYKGTIRALGSFGLGYFRENIELKFVSDKLSVEVLDQVTERLEGSSHHPLYSLVDSGVNESNSFISFLTDDLVTITTVTENSQTPFVYRMRDQNDRLLSFLAIFSDANTQTAVLETVDYIMMVEIEGKNQKTFKRKTKKFSFLPGSQMSELYIPIKIKDKDNNLKPAIYVNATALVGNNIYLMTKVGDDLVTPVDMSLNIPNNCTAKEPVKSLDGSYKYSILCLTNSGFKIKYVDLVAP